MNARSLKQTPVGSYAWPSASGVVPKSGRKSVLVIDPDAGARYVLAHWLSASYDVVEAQDGLSAISLAKLMPAPALVVCEVALPNIDGFVIARRLRQENKLRGVPLVFLTSRTSPRDVAQGIAVGARRYLFKPFVPDTVCTLLSKMIDA